jgi:hypothetical protein
MLEQIAPKSIAGEIRKADTYTVSNWVQDSIYLPGILASGNVITLRSFSSTFLVDVECDRKRIADIRFQGVCQRNDLGRRELKMNQPWTWKYESPYHESELERKFGKSVNLS